MPYVLSQLEVRVKELTNRENPITGNLELTLPDKRGEGNQICSNKLDFMSILVPMHFQEFNRIAPAQKPGVFPVEGMGLTRTFVVRV